MTLNKRMVNYQRGNFDNWSNFSVIHQENIEKKVTISQILVYKIRTFKTSTDEGAIYIWIVVWNTLINKKYQQNVKKHQLMIQQQQLASVSGYADDVLLSVSWPAL